MTQRLPKLSKISQTISVLTIILTAAAVKANPIPLIDHSFRSFDSNNHYQLVTPKIWEPIDVHNITLQFSDRYYFSNDTSLTDNRWLLHFADSINFQDIDFNFRIRLDGPGYRVRDAGWTSAKAGAANDPGFVYDPDRIVAHYTPNDIFKFGFGKERYNWGPSELGGLLLSDYNEGLTGFYQQYKLGSFVLRGVTAQLNTMVSDADSQKTHRYFSASRLEYYKQNYGFAVGQSMLYTGIDRSWDLRYFFPFYIFHYGQMTDSHGFGNEGQNSKGSIDGYYKIYNSPLEVYGELLIDDFQAHSDSLSKSAPNCMAWTAGVRLKDEALDWYGFIEGGRTDTYTYNHFTLSKQYVYNGNFLGSPLGPDQEFLWGKFGKVFYDVYNGALRVDANAWLRRSGERNINYRFPNIFGAKGDPVPYGIVEEELSIWASVSYRKFYTDASLIAGATTYKNRGNISSSDITHPFIGLFLSSGISTIINNH